MKKISKNVLFLGFVSLLNDTSSEIIYPFLPLFLTKVIGAKVAFVGLIEGIADATASILKIFSGYLSDKIKRRKLPTAFGYGLSAVMRPVLAVSTSWVHVLFVRFFDRVGKGVRTAPRDALIADSVSNKNYGVAYGFHRAMDNLGAVIGPLIGFMLIVPLAYNYRKLFLIASVFGFIAFAFVILFVEERIKSEKAKALKLSFSNLDKNFKFFLLSVFIFALGNSSDAFLLLRVGELGVETKYLPVIWGVFNLVRAIVSVPGGMLSDKLGRRPTIILGWLFYGLVYLGFAFAVSEIEAWVLFASYGIYFGLTEGVERAFVADISEGERRGFYFGVYNFVIGVSAFPSSLIFGLIWQFFGSKAAFIFGGFLALVAGVMLKTLVKEKIKTT